MTQEQKDKGKLTSLYEMLNGKEEIIHKVLIPKIQRDYAQGRNNEEAIRIRKRFLKSIFDVIDEPGPSSLMLDFIFGQKEEKTRNIFYPVDGQQRLTTLFLIHLYIGKRANEDTDFLKKFSYETRTSSKQFCERLHDIDPKSFCGIKKYIENQWWYTGFWRTDPTIKAMLNMLSDIDEHYAKLGYESNDFKLIWKRLISNVKFWRLYLSDLDTTDELYIKMNSRGKLLTDFEHFKAMLDEYAHTNGKFSSKVDTDWTNLLWRYRNTNNDLGDEYVNNGLDNCFYNLLLFYLNIEGCKLGYIDYSTPETDILVAADKVLGYHKDINKEYYNGEEEKEREKKNKEAEEIMSRFEKIMDFFSTLDNKTGEYVNDPKTFFAKYIQSNYDNWTADINDSTIPNEVKVFIGGINDCDLLKVLCIDGKFRNEATSLYMEAFFQYASSQSDNFLNRLRMLRNIVENTEIHTRAFKESLLLVDNIIVKGEPYIQGLNDEFNEKQKQQEIDKQTWVLENKNFENLLYMVENHWLFLGNLNCVMGIKNNKNTINQTALCRIGHLFNSSCDYKLIELALLTKGDYSPTPKPKKVKPYGGADWGQWKALTQSYNQVFPVVIQDFLTSHNDYTKKSLKEIIHNTINDTTRKSFPWEYYMVKYEAISSAPKAKYRYLGGSYSYYKLNANGGGRQEYFWNPYNCAVENILNRNNNDICDVDSNGGVLLFRSSGITVNIEEKEIVIKKPNGEKFIYDISRGQDGFDSLDRIEYAIDVLKKHVINVLP